MNNINFEKDRVDSITQVDQTKNLSDAVIELRNLEDQISASENHTKDLKENAQIVLSPGPVIFELRRLLKNYTSKDYLLLSGDPAIIGLACTIASDINSGRFNLLKWDRQEKVYYPLEINLYEKGKIDE